MIERSPHTTEGVLERLCDAFETLFRDAADQDPYGVSESYTEARDLLTRNAEEWRKTERMGI